jgi:hypothetical protein
MDIKLDSLTPENISEMLRDVRNVITESMNSPQFGKISKTPHYMKMIFLEQALSDHLFSVRTGNRGVRIVVENEEVNEAEVLVAIKGMVDNIQKMRKQLNDMIIDDLPAIVASIERDKNLSQYSEQFNSSAAEALSALEAAIIDGKTALEGALNMLTGDEQQFGDGAQGQGSQPGGADMQQDLEQMPPEDVMEPEAELPPEEPETRPVSLGRGRR